MSDQTAKDDAAKQRIVKHMNEDHHDSVIRYLEHYHALASYTAYDGKISDISLTKLSFSCASRSYHTPFEPPMTSYREARERLVEMDKDCVAALGRSDITVKEFIAPHGPYWPLFVTVTVTLLAFSLRSNFAPGGFSARFLPDAFRRFCWTIQPLVFYGMLFIHSWEAVHMGRGRLKKHNVNIRSRIYWLWLGSTFIEGVGCYHRFDKMINKSQIDKERQKH